MVSGFFTSPCDHWRIFSGDASEMRMALKESGSFGFSKKLKMSFTVSSFSVLLSLSVQSESARDAEHGRLCSSRPGLLRLRHLDHRRLLHQLDVESERL